MRSWSFHIRSLIRPLRIMRPGLVCMRELISPDLIWCCLNAHHYNILKWTNQMRTLFFDSFTPSMEEPWISISISHPENTLPCFKHLCLIWSGLDLLSDYMQSNDAYVLIDLLHLRYLIWFVVEIFLLPGPSTVLGMGRWGRRRPGRHGSGGIVQEHWWVRLGDGGWCTQEERWKEEGR